jgi:hypothetical protein
MELIALDRNDWEEIKRDIKEIKNALEVQGKTLPQKKWLSASAAGDLLNIKIRTVYLYCQKGLLHPHKAGGVLLFDRVEIEELIKGN